VSSITNTNNNEEMYLEEEEDAREEESSDNEPMEDAMARKDTIWTKALSALVRFCNVFSSNTVNEDVHNDEDAPVASSEEESETGTVWETLS
jgi:hypothetical protein